MQSNHLSSSLRTWPDEPLAHQAKAAYEEARHPTEAPASLEVMEDDSPRTLRGYHEALGEWLAAYQEYLTTGDAHARARVAGATAAASAALDALGFDVRVMPPPALGGYAVRGLYNVAFAHENTTWGGDAIPAVIDVVIAAQAQAKQRLREAERQRRNPFYWGDRFLRAILGFPVYLVGLILRIPPKRLDASAWGTVLRVVGLAVEVALAIVGGRQVGWW
jgi:hypothetical protein